jgi:hypothetical protein
MVGPSTVGASRTWLKGLMGVRKTSNYPRRFDLDHIGGIAQIFSEADAIERR